jgi:phosphoserine phosphatase
MANNSHRHVPPIIPAGSVVLTDMMVTRSGLIQAMNGFEDITRNLPSADKDAMPAHALLKDALQSILQQFDEDFLHQYLLHYPHLRKGAEELIAEMEGNDDESY